VNNEKSSTQKSYRNLSKKIFFMLVLTCPSVLSKKN
jgi:hypothetical protein